MQHVIFYVSFKKKTNILKQWMRLKLIRLRKWPDLMCFLNFVISEAHGLIFGERNDWQLKTMSSTLISD